MEIWKPVPEYEGLYEVSNTGVIRSIYRYKKELKPMISNTGYERVDLFKDHKRRQVSVHRVVASVFCHKPSCCNVVNHIDENKRNNNADNLEWTTQKSNANWGTARARAVANTDYHSRIIDRTNLINAVSKPISQYDKSGKFIKAWPSAAACSRETGIPISSIRRCALGQRKTAHGFTFTERSEMAY